MFTPLDHGVGVVILTNADTGGPLVRVVDRFLLELLFDGKPEAVGDLHTTARTIRESMAKERARLTVPADDRAVTALAERYEHPSLGAIVETSRRGDALRLRRVVKRCGVSGQRRWHLVVRDDLARSDWL